MTSLPTKVPVVNNNSSGRNLQHAVKRLRRALRFPLFVLGVLIILVYLVIAVFGPMIAVYDPALPHPLYTLGEPDSAFPFGTDKFGRDILTRVVYATRLDLMIALLVATLSFSIGALIGCVVGYYGGWVE